MAGRPEEPELTASPLYALGQLERAIRWVKAPEKAAMWRSVLAGMADGSLTIGSSTPVAGTPAWVTLEVAHGGFASGRLLAESPLGDDERALLNHASASQEPASHASRATDRA